MGVTVAGKVDGRWSSCPNSELKTDENVGKQTLETGTLYGQSRLAAIRQMLLSGQLKQTAAAAINIGLLAR
jgi:hypothetical protein